MTRHSSVRDFGGTGDLIILLHGFLSSKNYWSKLCPLLTSGYHVIALDLIGFGAAAKPKDIAYTYDDHLQYINTVLDEIGVDEPFILAGHSMGALLAKRYALHNTHRVKKLILIHPPLYLNPQQVHETLRNTGYAYRFLLDSKYRNIAWPIIRLALLGTMKHHRHSRELSMANVIQKAEGFNDLKQLEKQTLLVVGRHDRPEYIQNLNNTTLSKHVTVIMANTTHHSPVQQPLLVQSLVVEFLAL